MNGWQALILDGLVIAATTTLAALHIIPSEAAVAMLGMVAGARAMAKSNDKDPPAAGGGIGGAIAASTVGMLVLGVVRTLR